ncbi:hypothetical protein DRN38_00425 [Thermococci archaeon]|nr:MAG: hypothetical protein B6U96_15045 [Archaeoglobales archaeon ex4484_92]RLF82285.1 MAG: hypothetical protein DRN38_00425 [Thermococci archaeon]HDN73916.1 biotin/lipoyl-binding protein [Archaeoglobus sp.]
MNEEIVTAPLPGKILEIKAKEGSVIKPGDVVVVIESMKMENEIRAQTYGKVKEIKVRSGEVVDIGRELIIIERKGGEGYGK